MNFKKYGTRITEIRLEISLYKDTKRIFSLNRRLASKSSIRAFQKLFSKIFLLTYKRENEYKPI